MIRAATTPSETVGATDARCSPPVDHCEEWVTPRITKHGQLVHGIGTSLGADSSEGDRKKRKNREDMPISSRRDFPYADVNFRPTHPRGAKSAVISLSDGSVLRTRSPTRRPLLPRIAPPTRGNQPGHQPRRATIPLVHPGWIQLPPQRWITPVASCDPPGS